MKGTILDFNAANGQGVISGDDGKRYVFSEGDIKSSLGGRVGGKVDFQLDPSGDASEIYMEIGSGTDSKNKIVAALLAFFLGWLGIHKFYLGKNTAGVIMLAVSLLGLILIGIPTFIMGFIAFVEFIIYLTRSDEEFERVYVQGNKSWF